MEKRLSIYLAFFCLLLPLAFGDMDINLPDKDIYNLGEQIKPYISIKENENVTGFLKMQLTCGEYTLQYFTTPLNVEANSRTAVDIPELKLLKDMVGVCRIKATFQESDGKKIDSVNSNTFIVSDKILIDMTDTFQAHPGDTIILTGSLMKESNDDLGSAEADFTYLDKSTHSEISSGKLTYSLGVSYDSKSGTFPFQIIVKDKYGNEGKKEVTITIISVPTRIKNQIENDVLQPGDVLQSKIILYDQNAEIIEDAQITVKVFGPDELLLEEKEVNSLDVFEFATNSKAQPGTYFLLSATDELKQQDSFTVEEVRKVSMKQANNAIYLENVGNVNYEDNLDIILENEENKFLVTEKVDMAPGQTLTLDLSKEVPQGIYDISIAQHNFENVQIDDNRPVMKKYADTLPLITGAVVNGAGFVVSRPWLASVIIVIIILGIVTYYGKGLIKKKKDDTEDLFEDFDFEK